MHFGNSESNKGIVKDDTEIFSSIGLLRRPIAIESIDGCIQLDRIQSGHANTPFYCHAIDTFCVFALRAAVASDRSLHNGRHECKLNAFEFPLFSRMENNKIISRVANKLKIFLQEFFGCFNIATACFNNIVKMIILKRSEHEIMGFLRQLNMHVFDAKDSQENG